MPHHLQKRGIIWAQDFTPELLADIFQRADYYKQHPRSTVLQDKRVIMLFYEESTRTRFSFEAAVDDLGGARISTENAKQFSSVAKGETLEHSIRVISAYGDAIVLRHSDDDAAMIARDTLQAADIWVPVINAGCGGIKGQHPSQAVLDWYTIRSVIGRTNDLEILVAGDPKHGRTIRSLVYLAGKYPGNRIRVVSPLELAIGRDMVAYARRHDIEFSEGTDLREFIHRADVVYMTRIQKERLANPDDYERVRGVCRLTHTLAQQMKPGAIIMHPLPIVDEIDDPVSLLPQAKYFHQSDNGVPVRKALLEIVLGE